jgi:hypothetical protein
MRTFVTLIGAGLAALLALAACGEGEQPDAIPQGHATAPALAATAITSQTVTPSPAVGESLREALDRFLAVLSRGDPEGLYDLLSSSAKAEVSLDDWREIIRLQQETYGELSVSVDMMTPVVVTDDHAELELILTVRLGDLPITLEEVAFLEREDGRWLLADHFLQTALATVGRYDIQDVEWIFGPDGCAEGDVLGGVYAPARLRVLDPCVTATGTVIHVYEQARDGDLVFDLELDASYDYMLNEGNRQNTHGGLHIEIIPADQDRLTLPEVGQRLRVTGPWVLDQPHGHNEIHPVWHIERLP